MPYCICDVQKVKSFRNLNGLYIHNYRVNEPLNADPEMAELNEELRPMEFGDYSQTWRDKIEMLQEQGTMGNVRKDAVMTLSVYLSYSREADVDIEKWKKDSLKWLDKQFNIEGANTNNVISAMYHGDEPGVGPHIHAIVVPIDEKGRLNAKRFTGGKGAMIQIQDSYAKVMQKHGLERGERRSVAKHEDIRKWYTKLNSALYEKAPQYEKGEDIEHFQERVNEFVANKNLAHMQDMDKMQKKIVEAGTIARNEQLELRSVQREYKKKLKKIDELLSSGEKYVEVEGLSVNEFEKRLKTFKALVNGLAHMEDREKAKQLTDTINQIVKEEHEREKKTKKDYKKLFEIDE